MIDYRNLDGYKISTECLPISQDLSEISGEIDDVKSTLNKNDWDAGTRTTVEDALVKFKEMIDYAAEGFENLTEIGKLIGECNELAKEISAKEDELKKKKALRFFSSFSTLETHMTVRAEVKDLENDINTLKSNLSEKETKLSELQTNY